MEKTEWFQKAVQAIMDTDEEAAKKIASDSLAAGMDPLEMINRGFTEGIRKMGDLFERGEVFLPGLIVASEAMTAAVEILEAALPEEKQAGKKAVIVLGTVEGDIHDIGKGIVATMLRVHGYEVHDIGRDVPIEQFVEKAKALNADVVGSSAMMTTTQIGQKKLEEALKKAGIRDKVLTMVGGAVATDHWAQRIGSDFFGETPQDTIIKLEQSLQRRTVS
jgi:trimethylamine corrinoid protein